MYRSRGYGFHGVHCEKFFRENLKNIPLHPLEALWKIECAMGQHLLYAGYIEVGLRILLLGSPSRIDDDWDIL